MERVKVLLILVMIHWVTAATPWIREVRSTQGCQVPPPEILNAEKSCLHGSNLQSTVCTWSYVLRQGLLRMFGQLRWQQLQGE
ncbi:hypothetical protein B566_EDAN017402 [Ephemera danica]|nr:hypothetical protein B566_EDAN017402 [Ephemera danica]